MLPVRQPALRRGFTILELLIVMAIIMLIMALTAGAALRYMDVQKKRNTEVELYKLESAVHQAWNAVIANARDKEAVPDAVSQIAGGNAKRARVIYVKLRLKQEFPMTFQEVMDPSWMSLLGKPPTYITTIQGKSIAPSLKGESCESAALLYLALQKDRSGTQFNVDSALAKSEVATDTGSGLKYIVDGWGSPIAFYRWPYGNVDPTFGYTGQIQNGTTNDLEDPEGLLADTGWNTAQFKALCHPVSPGKSYKLKPAIASPGRDLQLGLDPKTMAPLNNNTRWYDNLYSYRVRESGKGD